MPTRPAAGSGMRRLRRRAEWILLAGADLVCVGLLAVGALVVAVLVLGQTPRGQTARMVGPLLVGAAAAVLAAAPARRALRAAVHRALRRPGLPADDALRTFGEQASRGVPLATALADLGDGLRRQLALRRVEIWTGAQGRLTAAVGVHPPAPTTLTLLPAELDALARTRVAGPGWLGLWTPRLLAEPAAGERPLDEPRRWASHDREVRIVPARAGGVVLGLVVVDRPSGAAPFSEAEDRLFAELGTRLGTVLHNHELDAGLRDALDELRQANDELRVSRARLVAAADAERRRIERDLHDGAQQYLVSLAVGIRLVRDLVAEDTDAAVELLGALGEQITETIGEVRDLAHGIYPPLLRSAGLAEALRAAGQRSPVGVTVRAAGIGRYSPEIEAAVYFCCLEALQNAAKHAAAGTDRAVQVVVTLAERPDALQFGVADDGVGLDPDLAREGHGITNMRDRIGAIGGSLHWEPRDLATPDADADADGGAGAGAGAGARAAGGGGGGGGVVVRGLVPLPSVPR
ncbi:Histidine kinase [Frankia canadensis]|uniref:histidine kinase n=2 Tax=Frankia canadensis TaxID=1836972 RepID=A0A2I2L203_9ACTN|nr:Histidine kinase [Frankia canadensis]SOU59240.1 Histidine kinase [Frankia canadensis]